MVVSERLDNCKQSWGQCTASERGSGLPAVVRVEREGEKASVSAPSTQLSMRGVHYNQFEPHCFLFVLVYMFSVCNDCASIFCCWLFFSF